MISKIVIAGALAASSFAAWRYTHPPRVEVFDTQNVTRGELVASVMATGTLNSTENVDVGAQVSGTITALYADFNTPVHKGQILALIDPGPFQVQLDEQRAALNSARAAASAAQIAVDQAKTGVEIAREQSQGQEQLAALARRAAQFSKVELNRSRASAAQGLISQDDLHSAENTYELADDDRQVAEGNAASAVLGISEKEAEVRSAQGNLDDANAQVKKAEASVALAESNLAHTEVLSPIDGLVLNRNVSAGETVAASAVAPVLFQLVKDLAKMQVDVNLDESDVGRVVDGDPATFTVDAFPNRTFRAIVRQVREEATNVQNVISFDVVLDVQDKGVAFLPGMTANVKIITATHPNVLKVPNSALRFRPEKGKASTVYTLDARRR
ncbi:MAG: efflux RND transporter periplasmic adaptor subunit [Acidobacteriota bacterium]